MSLKGIGPVVLVGAGKMGLAMARGWIAAGLAPADLVLVDPQPSDAAKAFATEHGARLLEDVSGVLVHVLVLAVKPQVIDQVMAEITPSIGKQTLVLSVAAGISLKALSEGLKTGRVIRTMPNTPAQVGKGITGAVAGLKVSDEDREIATELLRAGGEVIWFGDEAAIDAVTAVSGSGPAYVFYLVETLAAAGVKQGLTREEAQMLARHTIIGAAALLEADPSPPETLRANVTSPNGTTEAALKVLMSDPDGLEMLILRTVKAARKRSEELGK